MFKAIRIFLIITALFLIPQIAAAGSDIKDGLWEMSVKMEMPGMPMEMPPMKFNQCITKQNYVPHQQEQSKDCKITNNRIDGNTVTWDMKCSGRGAMTGNGRITYKGNTFTGTMKAVTNGMEMTQHMKGRRIGDCK